MPTYQEGGYSLEIDWSNFERLVGTLEGVPDRVCELTALDLEKSIKNELEDSKYTGQLRASWRADQNKGAEVMGGLFNVVTSHRGSIGAEWVVGSPLPRAAYLNDGTRPHCPPKAPIKKWAEFKGLPWFAVWKGICEHGTKANPYIDRAQEKTNREVPHFINQAIDEMKAKL